MASYYESDDLARFGNIAEHEPALWERFRAYYDAAVAPGSLSAREKALIALAVAHVLPCPYCIEAYSKACLERGATAEQMTEALHVAAALQAGATLAHGIQMKKVVDRLVM